jgi:hypothetical protein
VGLIRHLATALGLGAAAGSAAGLGLTALMLTTVGPAMAADSASQDGATARATPNFVTPGGNVTFAVACASQTSASATFFGTTLGLPQQIPMNRGALSGDFTITVTIPAGTQPGIYHPGMDCADGSSATATLHVTAFPRSGGAATGDGTTSTEASNGLAVGGLALIGGGAVLGGVALRRRSTARRH